ncbi:MULTISPECIES: hypothetical protein [Cupriavidus]
MLTLMLGFVGMFMIAELWCAGLAPDPAGAGSMIAELRAFRMREPYLTACGLILAAVVSALWALWATGQDLWLRCLAAAPILTIWILAISNGVG